MMENNKIITPNSKCINNLLKHKHENQLLELCEGTTDSYSLNQNMIHENRDFKENSNPRLVIDSKDDKIIVKLKYSQSTNFIICSLALSFDGNYFAYSNGRTVYLKKYQDGSVVNSWDIPNVDGREDSYTKGIDISKDAKLIAVRFSGNKILIIRTTEKNDYKILSNHVGCVFSILFLKKQNIMLSGGNDGYLCIWNTEDMTLNKIIKHIPDELSKKRTNNKGKIISITTNKDESLIYIGFLDGEIGIYDSHFKEPMKVFRAHEKPLYSISISTLNGNLATSSADNTIKIWKQCDEIKCVHILQDHQSIVLNASFSPLEHVLFSTSKDESFKAWNDETGELLFTVKYHQNSVFQIVHHPYKHSFLTSSGDGYICCWDYSIPNIY